MAIVFASVSSFPLVTSCIKNCIPSVTQLPVTALALPVVRTKRVPDGEPTWISTVGEPETIHETVPCATVEELTSGFEVTEIDEPLL